MIRFLNGAAFAAGLAAAFWVAYTHAGSHPAVLPMLLLIVAAFLAGAIELHRYRAETQALQLALDVAQASPPPTIEPWLATLPEGLSAATRLRLQGDRAALPGPMITPYLTGLLVLLGLLGTFIGMVATLGGTVAALGASADLQAVRVALAAPVQGLGLAFGTSVAGVAASAALGLMSALARAQRTTVSRALDGAIATVLHPHTEDHRRHLMLQALQTGAIQSQVLPAVAQRIEAALMQVAADSRAGIEALTREQSRFHERTAEDAARLSTELKQGWAATGASLEEGLREASRTLSHGLMQAAADGARASHALFEPVVRTSVQQLTTQVSESVNGAMVLVADSVVRTQAALSGHAEQTNREFARQVNEGFDQFLQRFEQRTAEWLAQAAREQAGLHGDLTTAATEAMTALRQQASDSLARDREQLVERERLLAAVDALMQALQHAATEQRQALDGLLASAAAKLDHSADRFESQAGEVAQQVATSLAAAAEQARASSQNLATIGEGFAQALQGFSQVNQSLGEQLARVESALGQHLARSDEQLAYYVAQAREVIELTLGAQQQLLEDLRRVSRGAANTVAPALQPAA